MKLRQETTPQESKEKEEGEEIVFLQPPIIKIILGILDNKHNATHQAIALQEEEIKNENIGFESLW